MSEPQRTITLHTFASVKGGVGKSTLAIVAAKLLANAGRVPALVDCDLTGTSIADGLHLCAPRLAPRPDGTLNIEAPPTGEHYGLDETRHLRRQRGAAGTSDRVDPPIYLNDVLQAVRDERPVRVDAALWRHDVPDHVVYLPSSSIRRDIVTSLDWLHDQDSFAWANAFLWALDKLVTTMTNITDIIVDLPPGTWGFPHEMMVIVSTIQGGKPLPDGYPAWHDGPIRWRTNPFLITSSDGNDILPSLEYVGHNRARLPTLQPLANRFAEGENTVLDRIRAILGPTLASAKLDELFSRVSEVAALGAIFKRGDVSLDDDDAQELRRVLRIEEGP